MCRCCGRAKIELGWDFFDEIISHPVPLDMNTLTALKRCSLGLDLYLWLAYRTFTLKSPLRLSWQQLYRQFGVDPDKASDQKTVQNFRVKILRELKKIKLAWPKLNYSTAPGVLIPASLDADHRTAQSRAARKLISPFPASQRPVSGLSTPGWDSRYAPRHKNRQESANRLFPQACVILGSFPVPK